MADSKTHILCHMVHRAGSTSNRSRTAFSMIDLIVSIAVIAILVAIMLPTLSMAQEAANRIKCASNLRQIGLGMQMFVFDNKSRLPDTTFIDPEAPDNEEIHETVHLRLSAEMSYARAKTRSPISAHLDLWDGVGLLYQRDYLADPRIFYCPSHEGNHDFENYRPQWEGAAGTIVGNYQYRIPDGNTFFPRITPERTLVADAMRSQAEYNHHSGNNMLKADMSVLWYEDREGLIFAALASDPDSPNAGQGVAYAWNLLDSIDPNAAGALPGTAPSNTQGSMGSNSDRPQRFP